MKIWSAFAHISWCARRFKAVRTQSLRFWARSVQCFARGVRSKFFSAGVDITICRVFSVRRSFVFSFSVRRSFVLFVFSDVRVFAPTYLVEHGTACHNSGFPGQRQVSGTISSKFGRSACRVPWATRAFPLCNAILFS